MKEKNFCNRVILESFFPTQEQEVMFNNDVTLAAIRFKSENEEGDDDFYELHQSQISPVAISHNTTLYTFDYVNSYNVMLFFRFETHPFIHNLQTNVHLTLGLS